MSRCILSFSILSVLMLSLSTSHADDTESLQNPEITPVQMQQAIKVLKQVAALDPETRRFQPSIQAIVQRCGGNASVPPTPSERSLANVLIPSKKEGGGGAYKFRGFLPLSQLNAALKRMPGIATRPNFIAGTRKTPLGRTIGYVRMDIQQHSNTLVDVPTTSRSSDVARRAASIRSRLVILARKDPLWWTRLSVGRVKGQVVVASPSAPDGYLITADTRFAQVRNTTPQQLAMDLIQEIRSTFDSPPGGMKFRSLLDHGASRREAVQWRAKGDAAYDRGALDEAERNYLEAVKNDPGCILAYAGLGGIYEQKRDFDQARENYRKALQCPNIQGNDRQDIQSRLDKISHE